MVGCGSVIVEKLVELFDLVYGEKSVLLGIGMMISLCIQERLSQTVHQLERNQFIS